MFKTVKILLKGILSFFIVNTTAPKVEDLVETSNGFRVVCKLTSSDGNERHVMVHYAGGVDLDKVSYLENFQITDKVIVRGQRELKYDISSAPLSEQDRAALASFWNVDDPRPQDRDTTPQTPKFCPAQYKL